VTELVTGLDLVEQQIRIAQGQPLALAQQDVRLRGHAIELRLCAEDPWQGYLPQVGTVGLWRAPPEVRADTCLEDGAEIGPFYDSMVAKIMAWADSREACIASLRQACERTALLGVRSNLGFLRRCLGHPQFAAGEVTTDFLGRQDLGQDPWRRSPSAHARAAAALLLGGGIGLAAGAIAADRITDRLPGRSLWLRDASHPASPSAAQGYTLSRTGGGLQLACEDGPPPMARGAIDLPPGAPSVSTSWQLGNLRWEPQTGLLGLEIDGLYRPLHCHRDAAGQLWVQDGADSFVFERLLRFEAGQGGAGRAGELRAPMSGRVIAVLVDEGRQVERGETLLVIESMKMEMPLAAPGAGRIAELGVRPGMQLAAGQVLLQVRADEDKELS
jgi:acetyl/propionyl-CoA carboxylase alpha subunit